VKHPDKRIWLFHQYRPLYDLYGTAIGENELTFTDEVRTIKEMVTNIDNITIREATRIYTISKNVSDRLKKYNNIDSLALYPPPEKQERFHSESYGDYVLYVGRLDAKKRVSLLLDAFSFVKTGVKCLVVGIGKEKERLERQAHDLGIEEKIKLMGYLPDEEVIRAYANALAVFYAPYDEDYGFATVEAFYSQKPVITTTDSGGVLEFVEDGENGCITGVNPREIAERIDWLFTHKKECRRLGSNGWESVQSISWDRVIERLVD
jgi:glycosyltransferase involved in cell wall biosynthesis